MCIRDRQGVVLFTSSSDINNFTDLPDKFENEYFYTYILNLYKKIYLKKLEVEFKKTSNLKKTCLLYTSTIYITIIVLACITLAGGIILIIKQVMK